MPVRIADSMKQQNDLDTFPVAYGADIWLDKNKGENPANYKSLQAMYNDDELGGGGSIQLEIMPTASADYVGKIVQYVGESGTYQKGHFYECILAHNGAGSTYAWEDVDHLRFNHVVYHCTVPPANEEYKPGDIIYYSGKTMGNFKNGYYYRAIPNATPQQHYGATFWMTSSTGTGYLCYTPFELRIGFIVYPTGTGGTSYPYEITDFDDTGITITPYGWSGEVLHYVGVSYTETVQGWEELEGGGGTSIFYGTMDEWNALSTEEKKQYDYMADNDESEGDSVVNAVENGNMHAVTSNAVYNAVAYRNNATVVCTLRRMRTDGTGVEETGTTRTCLVLPLVGPGNLALIIGSGEVPVNTTQNQQKFSFVLSGIAPNGIVNDGCLNVGIESQPSPYLGYCGGFGDFWVNGIPTGLSNTKCKARFMCVVKLQ